MPRNGSGTYTLPQAAFVSGTTISSSAVNSDLSDVASALSQSISQDGQTAITGAIKFTSGTAAAPGITFANDSTTGIYLPSASNLGLAAGGTSVVTSSATATTWNLNTTFSGTLTSTGTLAATNNATVGGTLAVTGNSTFTGTVSDPRGQYTGVLLNTLTASSSAALQDTTSFTSNYSWYMIIMENLVPGTAAVTLAFDVHSGGSYQTSSYVSANMGTAGASGVFGTSTGGMALNNTSGDLTVAAGIGLSGFVKIFNPSTAGINKQIVLQTAYRNGTPAAVVWMGGGWWGGGTGAIDGFQIISNSGNISTGTVKVYGFV